MIQDVLRDIAAFMAKCGSYGKTRLFMHAAGLRIELVNLSSRLHDVFLPIQLETLQVC